MERFASGLPACPTLRPSHAIQEIQHDIQPGKRRNNLPPRDGRNRLSNCLTKCGGDDKRGDEGVGDFSPQTCGQDRGGFDVECYLISSWLVSLYNFMFDNIIRFNFDDQVPGSLAKYNKD